MATVENTEKRILSVQDVELVKVDAEAYILVSAAYRNAFAERIIGGLDKVAANLGVKYKDGHNTISGLPDERNWSTQFWAAMGDATAVIAVVDAHYFTRRACRLEFYRMLEQHYYTTILLVEGELQEVLHEAKTEKNLNSDEADKLFAATKGMQYINMVKSDDWEKEAEFAIRSGLKVRDLQKETEELDEKQPVVELVTRLNGRPGVLVIGSNTVQQKKVLKKFSTAFASELKTTNFASLSPTEAADVVLVHCDDSAVTSSLHTAYDAQYSRSRVSIVLGNGGLYFDLVKHASFSVVLVLGFDSTDDSKQKMIDTATKEKVKVIPVFLDEGEEKAFDYEFPDETAVSNKYLKSCTSTKVAQEVAVDICAAMAAIQISSAEAPGNRVLSGLRKYSLFHGLDLSLEDSEPLTSHCKVIRYMNRFQRVYYVTGHGTTNEYSYLELAVNQMYEILKQVGEKLNKGELTSWQEEILLVYGGDPCGKEDDLGKLMNKLRSKLPGIHILAVQCDHWKKAALAGGPSFYHIDAFYFYKTDYYTTGVDEKNLKRRPYYGGYVDSGGRRIVVGATRFLAQAADYWNGLIAIGGGGIAKKELVYIKDLSGVRNTVPKVLMVVKAKVKNKKRTSKEEETIQSNVRDEEAQKLKDTFEYGDVWSAFQEMKGGLKRLDKEVVSLPELAGTGETVGTKSSEHYWYECVPGTTN